MPRIKLVNSGHFYVCVNPKKQHITPSFITRFSIDQKKSILIITTDKKSLLLPPQIETEF